MKYKTARIFIKKINNLVNEFENYISLNELLDSDSDTIHKENLKNTIKDAEKFIKGSDERKDDKSSKAIEKYEAENNL